MFKTVLNDMLIDENNHKENEPLWTKRNNERKKEKNNFMEFIYNILSGYDEENNIRDDSISFYLLKKKVSSNLNNFDGINNIEDSDNK